MGLLDKILSRGPQAAVRKASGLLERGLSEQAIEVLDRFFAEVREKDGAGTDPELMLDAWLLYARGLKSLGKHEEALRAYREAVLQEEKLERSEVLSEALAFISEHKLFIPDGEEIFRRKLRRDPKDTRTLLNLAKVLVKREKLSPEDFELIERAAEEFPMWTGGSELICRYYLEQGRDDEKALAVYKSAWSNHPEDKELARVLRDTLVKHAARDDFALGFYEKWLSEHEDPEVLRIYSNEKIRRGQISEFSAPFIEQAVEQGLVDKDLLRKLADVVLSGTRKFLPKGVWAERLYQAGLREGRLIGEYAETLVELERLDEEARQIYEAALRHHDLSRRAVYLLTQQLTAVEEVSPFAAKVYEEFINLFPDRADDKLYWLLSREYIRQKRVDEGARQIYHRALDYDPSDPEIIELLAHSYAQTLDTSEEAIEVYNRAFALLPNGHPLKVELAQILLDVRLRQSQYDQKTLRLIDFLLPRVKQEKRRSDLKLAQARCFLNLEFTDQEAKEAYLELYRELGDKARENPRLIRILAQIFIEEGADPHTDPLVNEILNLAFDIDKFHSHPEIAFRLLPDLLREEELSRRTLQMVVRAFDADPDRLVDLLRQAGKVEVLSQITQFYMQHFNFEQAAKAARVAFEVSSTDLNRFSLAKVLILEGKAKEALKHLTKIKQDSLRPQVEYWKAVAYLALGEPANALSLLERAVEMGLEVSPALITIRRGNALELKGDLSAAKELYYRALEQKGGDTFRRWVEIQRGVIMLKENDSQGAERHFERILEQNPRGRAENRFLAVCKLIQAAELLRREDYESAARLVANRDFRARADERLIELATHLLWAYGEPAFFDANYQLAILLYEACYKLDPERARNLYFLALAYHLLGVYPQALLYYQRLEWGLHPIELERNQAYCYMEAKQWSKAWKVFADLIQRGGMLERDYPLLYRAFLLDHETRGERRFARLDLPDQGLVGAAIYLKDGTLEKAQQILEHLLKDKERQSDPHLLWYLGKLHAERGEKEVAVHYWRQLVEVSQNHPDFKARRDRVLLELGLAFLDAGYAEEAMEIWEELRKLWEKQGRLKDMHQVLAKLYAATLSLNAFQLARRDQLSVAIEEWKKALKYDNRNQEIIQNLAIAQLSAGRYEDALATFERLKGLLERQVEGSRVPAELARKLKTLDELIRDLHKLPELDQYSIERINLESKIDLYRRVHRMYAILGLTKQASPSQVEREYFRLIKIYNPERHAEDFMLIEEAYENLTNPARREVLDLFAFNPVSVKDLRVQISAEEGAVGIFEVLPPEVEIPAPDYRFLKREASSPEEVEEKIWSLLSLNLNLGEWAEV